MNLEEGFHNSWKREGLQEALDSGIVITREEFIATNRQSRMNDAINTVKFLISKGFSIDESLEPIDEGLRDSVREQILREQQS